MIAGPRAATGRAECDRRAGAPGYVFAVLEAGDKEAEEVACDRPVDAVPDDALRGGFGGSAEGWLTPLKA